MIDQKVHLNCIISARLQSIDNQYDDNYNKTNLLMNMIEFECWRYL